MRSRLFLQIIGVMSIGALLITTAQGTPALQIPYPFFQKGMSYVTWSKEGFSMPASDESLTAMAQAGVNCVAIVPTWYQEKFDSLEMGPTERTPSDASMRHVIRKAHENGMTVMVKPHIDLLEEEGTYRGDIGFQTEEKWQVWFDNYSKFITHYARIAEEEGAELFSVGTELSFAATQTKRWRTLVIPAVRKIFSGHITYAANWDDYFKVEFWDALDYAGIDAYFPLTNNNNPSFEEIKKGWAGWLAEIERWQATIKKPVLFTECGYCSADSAAATPWEEAMGGVPNLKLQADCYRAVFETFWDKPWFFGVYWWNWSTSPMSGGTGNRRFTPQNKLALDYIKEWYGIPTSMKLARNTEVEDRLELESAKASQLYTEKEKGIIITGALAERMRYKDKQ